MEILKFKTNINCGGCIASVTPYLNAMKGIEKWEVDIANPNKILSVQTDNLNADEIMKTIEKLGFKAEII